MRRYNYVLFVGTGVGLALIAGCERGVRTNSCVGWRRRQMTQELVQKNDNKARLEFRFFYYTENYDEVVGYYRDVLGFAIVDSWGEGVNDRGTVFRSPKGSGLIEIEFGAGGAPLNAGLYIEVDDVDEWKTVVKAKGLSVARDIENTSYGHRSFWLVDPGGLRIGFFSKIVPE